MDGIGKELEVTRVILDTDNQDQEQWSQNVEGYMWYLPKPGSMSEIFPFFFRVTFFLLNLSSFWHHAIIHPSRVWLLKYRFAPCNYHARTSLFFRGNWGFPSNLERCSAHCPEVHEKLWIGMLIAEWRLDVAIVNSFVFYKHGVCVLLPRKPNLVWSTLISRTESKRSPCLCVFVCVYVWITSSDSERRGTECARVHIFSQLSSQPTTRPQVILRWGLKSAIVNIFSQLEAVRVFANWYTFSVNLRP